ncbi:MAG: TldD/PmbA family protein [Hellea sp.]|nr:TldD/PmbA family protein [Hellea sp.]
MSDPISPDSLRPALESLLVKAKSFGAEAADAVATYGRSLHVTVRGGEMEEVDNSEGQDIGLRVIIGQRQACVSSSDLSEPSLEKLAERGVAMARLAPKDPYCGLADPDQLAKSSPDLDLYDDKEISPEDLLERAKQIEAAALAVKGVTQAEGMTADSSKSAVYFMTSDGFSNGWRSSHHGLSGMALASRDGEMERDYDFHGTRWYEDLRSPDAIGTKAGERAIARLGARQIQSGQMPVLFDRRLAGSLLSSLLGAISGLAIARGTSFVKDKMGEAIFAAGVNIIDDPLIKRGNGSRPWDGEGVEVKKTHLVKDGILQTWILNSSAARQLKLQTTGHAARSISSPPGISASNAYIDAGAKSPAELMNDLGNGLLIREMFGPSLNPNTGDYSVGVAGFKIENGAIAHPVSEVTIASNILDMYQSLLPGSDLKFESSVNAPSLLVESMMVAGQ